jgi:predicted HAD superfamily phosphohydrolase
MIKIAFDVEGPIWKNFDLAWLTLEKLVKPEIRKSFYEKVRVFDSYDDLRWIEERARKGHSTGTTPIISSLIAFLSGLRNKHLLSATRSYAKPMEGVGELVDWLRSRELDPYFISSSHPASALHASYTFGIKSRKTYCSGKQLSKRELEVFDKPRRSMGKRFIDFELGHRFPFEGLGEKGELRHFLDSYLELCERMNKVYKAKAKGDLEELKKEQILLLERVKDERLRESLDYLLYRERGVMGGHRKREILEEIGGEIIYIGDSIVDADALEYSSRNGLGIAINCTNKQALLACDLNLVCNSLMELKRVISNFLSGRNLRTKLGRRKLFGRKEIEENLEGVIEENRKMRERL